jgi:hypothetical protein
LLFIFLFLCFTYEVEGICKASTTLFNIHLIGMVYSAQSLLAFPALLLAFLLFFLLHDVNYLEAHGRFAEGGSDTLAFTASVGWFPLVAFGHSVA